MIQQLKVCSDCNKLRSIWKSSGRDKYCKECWFKRQPPHSIPFASKPRAAAGDKYTKARLAYLAIHHNCQARLSGCTGTATEIHHKAGKIGELLTNVSKFLAVCRTCHDEIEMNPDMAKEMGLSESRIT